MSVSETGGSVFLKNDTPPGTAYAAPAPSKRGRKIPHPNRTRRDTRPRVSGHFANGKMTSPQGGDAPCWAKQPGGGDRSLFGIYRNFIDNHFPVCYIDFTRGSKFRIPSGMPGVCPVRPTGIFVTPLPRNIARLWTSRQDKRITVSLFLFGLF